MELFVSGNVHVANSARPTHILMIAANQVGLPDPPAK